MRRRPRPLLVVGFDGSEESRAAVIYAAERAGKAGRVVGRDFDLELVRGSPAAALVQTAAEQGADEIVVGSRGFGRVRAALGSVSHDVLARADRPVVVVPHGALSHGET